MATSADLTASTAPVGLRWTRVAGSAEVTHDVVHVCIETLSGNETELASLFHHVYMLDPELNRAVLKADLKTLENAARAWTAKRIQGKAEAISLYVPAVLPAPTSADSDDLEGKETIFASSSQQSIENGPLWEYSGTNMERWQGRKV
jgi:hypothetical protein